MVGKYCLLYFPSCRNASEQLLNFFKLHEPLVLLDLFEGGEALPGARQVLLLGQDAALEVLLAQVEPAEVELALHKVADFGVPWIDLD